MRFEDIKSDTKFCHYTTVENARRILSTGIIYLSRLDQMNDLLEIRDHKEDQKRIFIASFCNSEAKSIPMFYLYSGIDGKGCRIEFTDAKIRQMCMKSQLYPVNSHHIRLRRIIDENRYDLYADWVLCKIRDKSLGYMKGKLISEKDPAYKDFILQEEHRYFLKAPWWRYENEFRIVVKFHDDVFIDSEKIALDFDISENEKGISVLFGPETSDQEMLSYKDEFKEYGITKCSRIEDKQISMGLIKRNRHLLAVNENQ